MARWARPTIAGLGFALVALSLPLAAWLSGTSFGREWWAVVDITTTGRPGLWRLLRGGLAILAIPALLAGLAVLLWVTFRRSPRRAAALAGIALASNVGTQLVKHAPFGLVDHWRELNPLSGHVAVAAGVCLGWLVVAPDRLRRRSAVAAWGVVSGVSAGVILASWHSAFQVMCPLLMATGCALLGSVMLHRSRSPFQPAIRPVVISFGLVLGALITAGVAVELVATSTPGLGNRPDLAVGCAVVFAVGMSSAAVGCVVACTGSLNKRAGSQPPAFLGVGAAP